MPPAALRKSPSRDRSAAIFVLPSEVQNLKKVLIMAIAILMLASCARGGGDATKGVSHQRESSVSTESEAPVTETVPATESETEPPEEPIPPEAERWLSTSDDPDAVIMTESDIASENERMRSESDTVVSFSDFGESISGGELTAMLNRLGESGLPKYTSGGREVTQDEYYATLGLRGLDTVERENRVWRGIVTRRADMRRLPCDMPYFEAPGDLYDTLQLTEVPAFSPILVLYVSTDGEFVLAQAYNYFGWISAGAVAVTDDDALWLSFAEPTEFLTVTDARLKVGDVICDMGVRLPLEKRDGDGYTVSVPLRDSGGMLISGREYVSAHGVRRGYLPFTYRNFISQAFKYAGTEYSWGGRGGGVDCSGFVLNVMSTFGFRLPRDTGEQCRTVGSHDDLRALSPHETAVRLAGVHFPTAVYYRGHTLLYLGYDPSDGSFHFIHAPRIGESVSLTSKYDLSGMTYICTFGDI